MITYNSPKFNKIIEEFKKLNMKGYIKGINNNYVILQDLHLKINVIYYELIITFIIVI